ncbi:unnamed protein product [Parnassius apollo]|uniref:(apollo) hypothetical protein n=1 Tax=Parnassius apollo TaxID=110799 RepID=A0A8S3Y0X5_PARAO|nr:unnamed protein product [Parnassius apollo]
MDEVELRLLNKRCCTLANQSYKNYIKKTEDSIKSNPKLFWSFIKAKKYGKSNYPCTMTDGIKKSSSPREICDLFASYFGAVYNSQDNINSDLNVSQWNLICNYSLELTAPYLSKDQILKNMKSLDLNKGPGSDCFPPLFIKACADELVTPIYLIFKKSLQSGLFPDVWKFAKVVPIHKADNVEVVGNYRHISILSTLSKIFESLVYPVLQNHLNHYLTEWQHGFVRFRSTCSNLTLFTETLVEAVDNGRDVDVIYTDLSKAFDKVNCVLAH